ncbi:tubulin epsilon chain isoform X4 [Marmota flaviventris]|uniref:tubulin epsilon chain isoform X4 n=1 Tax=Marmota flaviventris TaxID=93162 RepID=UPI003A8780C8
MYLIASSSSLIFLAQEITGTGSGLGTFLLKVLEDEFPEVYRFVTSVYPSGEDDVITSPYNSILAMKELNEHADCVLPIDNQSLFDIISKIDLMVNSGKLGKTVKPKSLITSSAGTFKKQHKRPFDAMNNIVANLMLNLTSSSRFEGSLNMDINEISMNLVPFPQLHYLVSSLTPLYTLADINVPPRRLDQMFSDAFSKDYQLIQADPKHSLYLACALMVRGNVQISDLRRNIERLKPSLHFVSWNQEGWKTSLCSVPPVGHSHSLLALANNTCVKPTFVELRERFMRLYKKKYRDTETEREEGRKEMKEGRQEEIKEMKRTGKANILKNSKWLESLEGKEEGFTCASPVKRRVEQRSPCMSLGCSWPERWESGGSSCWGHTKLPCLL